MPENTFLSSDSNVHVEEEDVVFEKQTENGNGKSLDLPVKDEKVQNSEKFQLMNESAENYEDPEEKCGILCFKPNFLQKMRNMKSFLLVFIITGMAQGMYWSYWNMTLTSIEKRFQIPSRTTGMITAINEVSHFLVVLFVAHFCSKGHRSRWLAFFSLLFGVAVLICAAPELFANKWDAAGFTAASSNLSETTIDTEICLTSIQAKATEEKCDAESLAIRNDIMWPIIVLAVSQTLLGIGTTAPIVLAMPLIDDNVKIKNAPIYYAFGLTGRFIGPIIGVFLGGFCLSTYVDLSAPAIAQNDPRWMGAWWLGFLVTGFSVIATSFLYLCFPRTFSRDGARHSEKTASLKNQGKLNEEEKNKPKLSTLPRDIKRLFVNKLYMCRLFNDCIDMLVISGYYNFAPKYIEFHFRMSPSQAGQVSGLSSILAMGLGAAVGGLIIRRFKFQMKQVAFGIFLSSLITSICYLLLMLVRCEPRVLQSARGTDGMLLVDTPCSNACNCAGKPFSPVCHEEYGVNYYSPCHAGCMESLGKNESKYYTNCRCLVNSTVTFPNPTEMPNLPVNPTFYSGLSATTKKFLLGADLKSFQSSGIVKRGFCEGDCEGFWTYVAISFSFNFIGLIPFSGSQMLSFRIVEPDLKALSKGIQTMVMSLFAFIPGPIIMGFLVDSTCQLWNTLSCDQKGACLVYDLDGLRIKMHLYVGVIKVIACVMDIYVFFKVKHMKFERDPEPQKGEVENPVELTGSVKDLTTYG